MELTLLLASSALALMSLVGFSDLKDYGEGAKNKTAPKVLENRDGSRNHWQGIGRLSSQASCTATLLDTRSDTGPASTPAYVLTSGHCVSYANGQFMTNSPIFGSISFNYFTDASQHKHYDLKTVKWRSMQGVDLAIIELENVSLQQLINDGIEPLKLATRTPDRDSDVLVVGAPQYRSLQMSACTLQPASDVIEGQWVWRNNFMTRCQGIEPGSSGSPLLDRSTNEIIGVVGTGNFDDLRTPCIINNPCILKHGRYTAVRNNVYGNPTAFLQGCFKEGVMVEDDASACQLYPTFNVTSQQPPTSIKLKRGKDKKVIAPDWDYQFTIDTTFYRHKTVSVASECENPLHYGSVEPSANAHINNQIHWQNGRAFLCIVGVESEQQPLDTGLMRNALSLPVNLLN